MTNRFANGRLLPVLLAAAFVGPLGALAADDADLKPRFAVPEPTYIQSHARVQQSIKMAGMPEEMTSRFESLTGFLEKGEAKDGRLVVQVEILRRMMSIQGGVPPMDFDTDSGQEASDDNSMALMTAPWLGAKLGISVQEDGLTGSIEGLDKLRKAVDDSAMGDQFYEYLKNGLLGEVEIGQALVGRRIAMLAGKTVQVGDTWTNVRRLETSAMGATMRTSTCKLERIEKRDGRDVAVVTYTSQVAIPDDAKPLPPFNSVPKITSSAGKGTAIFDLKTGQPIDIQEAGQMELTIESPAPSGEGTSTIEIGVKEEYTAKAMSPEERKKQQAEHRAAAKKAAESKPAETDDD